MDVTTSTLDNPELAPPTVQINHRYAVPLTDGIVQLYVPDDDKVADNEAWNATIVSSQGKEGQP